MYSIIPQLNNDKKYYTPCFIVPVLVDSDSFYKQKFNDIKKQSRELDLDEIVL